MATTGTKRYPPITYNNDPDVFYIFRSEELAKIYQGRYLCNRGPEGANYEVICPRAVTGTKVDVPALLK